MIPLLWVPYLGKHMTGIMHTFLLLAVTTEIKVPTLHALITDAGDALITVITDGTMNWLSVTF